MVRTFIAGSPLLERSVNQTRSSSCYFQTGSPPALPKRTAVELSFYLLIPTSGPRGQFEISYGEPPQREASLPPAPSPLLPKLCPLERARQLQSLMDTGRVGSRAELARLLGISRAAVTQALRPLARG